jgi:lambda family phage minor tail protein L
MSTLQTNIQAEINKLQNPAAYVELFKLDCSVIGGSIYYFTNQQSTTGGSISFGGQAYTPIPIIGTGFDTTTSGTLPKPSLSIGNVNRTLLAAVDSLGDLVGAKLTRMRTYDKFLDGGTAANSSAYIGPEVWIVEQKTQHDRNVIQWSLTTQIDRMGFRFGRQCLKDQSVKNLYCPGIARTRVT